VGVTHRGKCFPQARGCGTLWKEERKGPLELSQGALVLPAKPEEAGKPQL
jgi:hypothetical protein